MLLLSQFGEEQTSVLGKSQILSWMTKRKKRKTREGRKEGSRGRKGKMKKILCLSQMRALGLSKPALTLCATCKCRGMISSLALFDSIISGFLFKTRFGPSDLEQYAVDPRHYLISIVLDIMRKLLLVTMGCIVGVGRKRTGREEEEHLQMKPRLFTYTIRGCSNIDRKSTILGVRGIIQNTCQ